MKIHKKSSESLPALGVRNCSISRDIVINYDCSQEQRPEPRDTMPVVQVKKSLTIYINLMILVLREGFIN